MEWDLEADAFCRLGLRCQGCPHLHVEGLQVMIDCPSPLKGVSWSCVSGQEPGREGVDLNAYRSQLQEFLGFLYLLNLTRFSVWWHGPLPHSHLHLRASLKALAPVSLDC